VLSKIDGRPRTIRRKEQQKQNAPTMDKIRRPSLLLAELRRKRWLDVVDPTTAEAARQKAKLITEHRSEFPSKLRAAIEAASVWDGPERRPEVFLSEVYESAKELFFGRSILNEDAIVNDGEELELSEGWHGLDSDVDTEEEVELAIRFFPIVLTERLSLSCSTSFSVVPILMLFSNAKAVSFVPLFVKLCVELGRCEVLALFFYMKLLLVPGTHAFVETFGEEHAASLFGEEASAEESDEESLSALMRMGEMGFVKKRDTEYLLKWLLSKAKHRDSEFTEKRLRLLIDWNPSMLMEFRKGTPLLCMFLGYYTLSNNECSVLRMFEVIFELGMSYFPSELGFVFHLSSNLQLHASIFHNFSSEYGTERVSKIVHDKIISTLGPNNTMQSLVIAAATNNKICLDGLNTILCSDPSVLIPESSARS
jgi:hypothetical protein